MTVDVGLLISGATVLVSVVGSWTVIRFKGERNKEDIHNLQIAMTAIGNKLDGHGESIVELRTKQNESITARECDDRYVSKELFRQMEKHIDTRFDSIEKGVGKILEYLQGSPR